jgi:hypothetical protein
MAFDKSEPRVGLIFQIGLFVIVTLVGIRAALISYFANISSDEEHRKIGMVVPTALLSLRADEDQRLKSGPMPVEQAMQAIVAKGRMGASPDIVPSASRDMGPMQGWMKMPNEVPSQMLAAMESDGGAPVAPATSATPDAGAPHAAAPGAHGPASGPIAPAPPGTPKKPAKK